MKEILLALGVMGCAIAVAAGAVFAGGDGETLVPPPESAAEDFARALSQARYEIAWQQLASDTRDGERVEQMRARFAPVLAELGKINAVDAGEVNVEGRQASAVSRVDGSEADVSLTVIMLRENGLWKIARWDVAGGAAISAPAPAGSPR